ncbi:MAG: thiolase family protein [Parvularculaceae bacterium]|nr:thiolase family protein [Parvularculaceae bacterium]
MTKVAIIGVGLHKFGRTPEKSGLDQGAAAARAALNDANIDWRQVNVAFGGSMDAGDADALVNRLGLTGVQFTNVWNGCATGGSALVGAVNAIQAGEADIAMAAGFDKHPRGAFNADPESLGLPSWYGRTGMMLTPQFFALKIQRYMHEFGLSQDLLVKVAEKAFRNGALNPLAWRQSAMTHDEIANSPLICDPLRKYMFCSPAEGGGAIILASEKAAARLGVRPIWVSASVVRSRSYGSFEVYAPGLAAKQAPSATVTASNAAFEKAGIGPEDVNIAQLQDTDAGAEIMHLAENGFCRDGEQEHLIRDGATEIDGRLPVNTDGGLLANGEPIGASALRQIYELCLQLRGRAGKRQAPGAPRVGYAHAYGAPGVSGVTILST